MRRAQQFREISQLSFYIVREYLGALFLLLPAVLLQALAVPAMSATVNWTDATGNWNNSRLDYSYSTTERGKTFNLTGSGASLGIEQTSTLTLGTGTKVQGQGSVGLAKFPSGTSSTLNNQGTISANINATTLSTNPNNFTNQGTRDLPKIQLLLQGNVIEQSVQVPEPNTWILIGLGLVMFAYHHRRIK
jgi:hypothetical protein